MPLIGLNIGLRASPRPKYTYLDWIGSDGRSIVMTDFMLDTLTHPMETTYLMPEIDSSPSNEEWHTGNWAVVVAAGCQNDGDRGLYFVCCNNGNEGVPRPAWWINNGIYFPPYDSSHTNGCYFTDDETFKTFLAYKTADDTRDSSVVLYVDGVRKDVTNPGWTTASVQDMPQPVSFMGTKSSTGAYSQRALHSRLKRFTVYDSPDNMTPIADFVPVMLKDVAGMLDDVSGAFYPEEDGKLVCCLDGQILDRQ